MLLTVKAYKELQLSLQTILERWAIENQLTYQGASADWVVRWATDLFGQWDEIPQPDNRLMFKEYKLAHDSGGPHLSQSELTNCDPPPTYLIIAMERPCREKGERKRDFFRRMNRAVRTYQENLRHAPALRVPPIGSELATVTTEIRPRIQDHLSLAFRICGLSLKVIKHHLGQMGWPGPLSSPTISRRAKNSAELIQLDPL
jgi:hypothetical protein